jgi:hypothetical protein
MPQSRSDPTYPPMGVADELLKNAADSVERFQFWLFASACTELGARFWRTAVLRECLLPPETEPVFEALAEPLG